MRCWYWCEGYLKGQGLNVPLVVSEAAVKSRVGQGCPLGGGAGWTKCGPDWQVASVSNDPAQAYGEQLAWYEGELQKDGYVRGAALFTAGAHAPGDWATSNLDDMLVPLAWYMGGLK